MGYTDLSFYLGLRRLAGIRSAAPAVIVIDQNLGQEVYVVRKNEIITLWGCEMMPLQSDCIRISYKSTASSSWTVLKDYLAQTSLGIFGSNVSADPNLFLSGSPSLADNYELNDPVYKDGFKISGVTYCREHDSPFKTVGYSGSWIYRQEQQIHAKVSYNNFGRGFRFFQDGYYKFDYDESKSALYKKTTGSANPVDPDAADYNTFKYNGSVPWTPVDRSLYEHGDVLLRSIIIRCATNFDAVANASYSDSDLSSLNPTVSSLPINTNQNICRKIGLQVKSKSYDVSGGSKPTCSANGFLIDISSAGVASTTVNQFDTNMSFTSGTIVKNIRNRTFDTINFVGPGDFVQHISPIPGSDYCAQPVDMRNSRFYNCTFKNVIFGSPGKSQLILDGSIFFQCNFESCKLYLNPKNILFKNCTVNNSSVSEGFLIMNGSFGNMFTDLIVKDTNRPFVFVNNENSNNSNFIIMSNFSQGGDVELGSCPFVNVVPGSNTANSSSFSGNIIMRNYIDDGSGDPVRIEKTSAHGNFFGGNYMISHGNLSLAEDLKQKQKNKDFIRYPSIKPYTS